MYLTDVSISKSNITLNERQRSRNALFTPHERLCFRNTCSITPRGQRCSRNILLYLTNENIGLEIYYYT